MNTKTIAENRVVRHEYFIVESYEAGIELAGTEVKSIRNGGVNLKDSWISIDNGEAFIRNMHISPYEKGNIFNKDPYRVRKLLLHKKEILKLFGQVKQGGYTLIPISLYFKDSKVKVQVGLCKGKKLHDKRDDMAKRDASREMERAMKERNHEKKRTALLWCSPQLVEKVKRTKILQKQWGKTRVFPHTPLAP